MVLIWYVIFSPSKNEDEIIRSCKNHLSSGLLDDAFIFTYDRMKRYQGSWHTESRPMFPGYVFLESRDGAALKRELSHLSGIGKPLESDQALLRVTPEEEALLKALCGRRRHLAMSRGYIREGGTHVTEGPLTGREHLIRRIDRHKRLTRLEAPMALGPGEIYAGLEIVEKT